MILSEAVFYRGSEVGQILEDLDAGRVQFKPPANKATKSGLIISCTSIGKGNRRLDRLNTKRRRATAVPQPAIRLYSFD